MVYQGCLSLKIISNFLKYSFEKKIMTWNAWNIYIYKEKKQFVVFKLWSNFQLKGDVFELY